MHKEVFSYTLLPLDKPLYYIIYFIYNVNNFPHTNTIKINTPTN